MKKQFSMRSLFLLLFSLTMVVGCVPQTSASSSSSAPLTATVSLQFRQEAEPEALVYTANTTLLDLLSQHYDLMTTVENEQIVLQAIDSFTPLVGSQFEILNGATPVTSLLAPVEVGATYTISISWVDERQQAVDQAIQAFLDHQAAYYLADSTWNYQVLAALHRLDVLTSFDEVPALITSLTEVDYEDASLGEWFKAVVALTALDVDLSILPFASLQAVLAAPDVIGLYANPSILGLLTMVESLALDPTRLAVLTDIVTTNSPRSADIDFGATIALALAPYRQYPEVQLVVDEYFTWLPTVQATNGSFVENFPWSTENSAIIANVILALSAYDYDPLAAPFTQGSNSMIDALLAYVQADGSFLYLSTDEEADLAFSTPLGFAALVVYQQWMNGQPAVLYGE